MNRLLVDWEYEPGTTHQDQYPIECTVVYYRDNWIGIKNGELTLAMYRKSRVLRIRRVI